MSEPRMVPGPLAKRPRWKRRRAAALVEFTVCFLMFFGLLLALLELCRALNTVILLNSVASVAARFGARDDPLGDLSNVEVEADALREAQRLLFAQDRFWSDADINHISDAGDFYFTKVTVAYRLPTVFLPLALNGTSDWNLSVSVVRPNDSQSFRPGA